MKCYNLENEIKTKHIEAVFKLESLQKKNKNQNDIFPLWPAALLMLLISLGWFGLAVSFSLCLSSLE